MADSGAHSDELSRVLSSTAAPFAFFGLLMWVHDTPAQTAKESDAEYVLPPVERFVRHASRHVKQSSNRLFRLAMLNTDRDTDPAGPSNSMLLSSMGFLFKPPKFVGHIISRSTAPYPRPWLLCPTQVPSVVLGLHGSTVTTFVFSENDDTLAVAVHDPIIRVRALKYSVESRSHLILGSCYQGHTGSSTRYLGRLSFSSELMKAASGPRFTQRLKWQLTSRHATPHALDDMVENPNNRNVLGVWDGRLMELSPDGSTLLRDSDFDTRRGDKERQLNDDDDPFVAFQRVGMSRIEADRTHAYILRLGRVFVVQLNTFALVADVGTATQLLNMTRLDYTHVKAIALHPGGDTLLLSTGASLIAASRKNPKLVWAEWGRNGCHFSCARDVALGFSGVLAKPASDDEAVSLCVIEAPSDSPDRRVAWAVFSDGEALNIAE